MDTKNNNNKNHFSFKLVLPFIVLLLVLSGYFVYQGFFASPAVDIDVNSNAYIKNTKLGKNVEILNKENLIFTSNINDKLFTGTKDFSQYISPSYSNGRTNPFLP